MPVTRSSKRHTVIPNGLSEEENDSSELEDEISKTKRLTLHELTINEQEQPSSNEESNAEEIVQKKKPPPRKKKTFNWKKKDFAAPIAVFVDNLPPPPVDKELEPIDYFYFQTDPNKPLSVSENEMEHFIGVLIMTGVYSFLQQRFFWMDATCVTSISSVMSRDRFLQIKKYLHVVDNPIQPDRNDPNFDRPYKVRPLLDIVKENFRRNPKEENLSVDEQIISFKGRGIMKQHMPMKPNRWGYKMFVLAGGETGICYNYIFYTGKGEKSKHGFCANIVLALCETVPRSINHKIFCDNFYTTIQLQVELHKLGIYAAGTVRENRLSGLVMKKNDDLSKEGRGEIDHRIAEVDGVRVCVTKWYDNNVVNCLSALYGCHPIDSVQRWSTKEKKNIQISRPNVIQAYNRFMGGVDLHDTLISLYRINVRSQKYYMKIIFHLIDMSVVNAWLLYRRHCTQFKVPRKNIMSLLSFRIAIAESLLKSCSPPPPPLRRGRSSLSDVIIPLHRVSSSKRQIPRCTLQITTSLP